VEELQEQLRRYITVDEFGKAPHSYFRSEEDVPWIPNLEIHLQELHATQLGFSMEDGSEFADKDAVRFFFSGSQFFWISIFI
jgi:hypothetical protein